MTNRRIGIIIAVSWFGAIGICLAMNLIEIFGFRVIRLKFVILYTPFRRNSRLMGKE